MGLLALDPDSAGEKELKTAVTNVNQAIISRSLTDERLLGMGTTMTAALIKEGVLLLAHVGDSRAYLFREGRLEQLTDDHSWVGEMVRRGELTPAQAAVHPHRSIITRALGTDFDLEPDLKQVEIKEGDRILLCTDGLSGLVSEAELTEILSQALPPQAVAERLVTAALGAGGDDNVTAIVVDVLAGDESGQAEESARRSGEGESAEERGDRILVGPADRQAGVRPVRRKKTAVVKEKLGFKPGSSQGAESSGSGTASGAPGEAHGGTKQSEVTASKVEAPATTGSTPQEAQAAGAGERRRRRRWLYVAVGVAILLIAVVGFAIFNSTVYYVGEYQGKVALYRGLPATVAGIDLSAAIELGSVPYESLNPYLRSRVDAHELVSKQEGQQFLQLLESLSYSE